VGAREANHPSATPRFDNSKKLPSKRAGIFNAAIVCSAMFCHVTQIKIIAFEIEN
jgi:hypothetical protein